MNNQSIYFEQLNATLKKYKRAIPCLLIDLDILDKNLELLKNSLAQKKAFRIVVKSLPSVELIEYIIKKANTKKLMIFHQPFLSHIVEYVGEDVNILLGKPMPAQTVAYFYKQLDANFKPNKQIQWLIDTYERANQYLALAQSLDIKMKLNIELDVGLHRGGISNLTDLKKVLQLIEQHADTLEFTGFMGYDPHIPKLPDFIISQKKSI